MARGSDFSCIALNVLIPSTLFHRCSERSLPCMIALNLSLPPFLFHSLPFLCQLRIIDVIILPFPEQPKVKDYCNSETFRASCPDGSVVLMATASYGRMRLGRCASTDFGYIGCSSDVLHLMDRSCSGRQSCSVRVADPMFEEVGVCNKEFKSYLEASYSCIPGQ